MKDTDKEHKTTVSMCEQEKLSYEDKQALRQDEIDAIGEAVEILTTRVRGATPSFAETSLLQIRDGNVSDRTKATKVSIFLSKRSEKISSKVLSLLAAKIAEDPFVKVRGLIENMINKLQ